MRVVVGGGVVVRLCCCYCVSALSDSGGDLCVCLSRFVLCSVLSA